MNGTDLITDTAAAAVTEAQSVAPASTGAASAPVEAEQPGTAVTEVAEPVDNTPIEMTDATSAEIDTFLRGFNANVDTVETVIGAPGSDTTVNVETVSEPKGEITQDKPETAQDAPAEPAETSLNADTEAKTEATAEDGSAAEPQTAPEVPQSARAVSVEEWTELVEAHPEVVGNKLPNEVFKAIISSNKSPLQVYESMMLKQSQTQVNFLTAENARLKKEIENFRRAPVIPTEGGAPKTEPKDPFLEGFMRYGT